MTGFHRLQPMIHSFLRVLLGTLLVGVLGLSGGGGGAIASPLTAFEAPALEPSVEMLYEEALNAKAEIDPYDYRTFHSPDGTGKFYMGREIATYMSHTGAAWLERPSRDDEESPTQLINALNLKPTDTVADLGAGTGYFSFRLSAQVPEGQVLAVDIQPEMLEMLDFFKTANQTDNIESILGEATDPHIPVGQVDLALMVDAYHEFEYPCEMMTAIVAALKPGGRVALVEYRGEDWFLPIKRLHKMTEDQAKQEMQSVGLTWQETLELLPQQHLMLFAKPLPSLPNLEGI